MRERCVEQSFHVGASCHVAVNELAAASRGADACRHGFAGFPGEVVDDHGAAFACESFGDSPAESGGGAGDDCDFSCQASTHDDNVLRKKTTRSVSVKPRARCMACESVLSSSASEANSAAPCARAQAATRSHNARATPRRR